MGQTEADHPGSDKDPSDKKRTGARTARRDERKREKAAMGLTKTAASGPRGAHDASNHKRKAPPDMLTGRSVQACLSRDVPTDHEAHGQRSGGCRWAGASISAQGALAGSGPRGQSRTREARSYPHSG